MKGEDPSCLTLKTEIPKEDGGPKAFWKSEVNMFGQTEGKASHMWTGGRVVGKGRGGRRGQNDSAGPAEQSEEEEENEERRTRPACSGAGAGQEVWTWTWLNWKSAWKSKMWISRFYFLKNK